MFSEKTSVVGKGRPTHLSHEPVTLPQHEILIPTIYLQTKVSPSSDGKNISLDHYSGWTNAIYRHLYFQLPIIYNNPEVQYIQRLRHFICTLHPVYLT